LNIKKALAVTKLYVLTCLKVMGKLEDLASRKKEILLFAGKHLSEDKQFYKWVKSKTIFETIHSREAFKLIKENDEQRFAKEKVPALELKDEPLN